MTSSPLQRGLLLCIALCAAHLSVWSGDEVVVNGIGLTRAASQALELRYRMRLIPGRYWYDARSGLWGLEGGPSAGQIDAGLTLPRPMHAQASVGALRGITRVFVNGRELHPQELRYLQQLYGAVRPARYWLDARGVGGYEGGPPQFDLRAAAIARRPLQGGTAYARRSVFGNNGSDGRCSYYNDPSSGASVMTGNC